MLKKTFLVTLALPFSLASAFAQPCCTASTPLWSNFYIGVEGGYSISARVDFKPDYDDRTPYDAVPPGFVWDVPNGVKWSDDFNTTNFWGANIGYKINCVLALQLDYSHRSDFEWETQTNSFPDLSIGDRWRIHDIDINTLLFNVNLKPMVCWYGVRPFAHAGVGVAWNKTGTLIVSDIASPNPESPFQTTYIVNQDGERKDNFAWNIGAGLDYACNSNLHLTLGYRFVDVGKVKTGTHFEDLLDAFPPEDERSHIISPFEARHVQLNEVYLGLTYHIC